MRVTEAGLNRKPDKPKSPSESKRLVARGYLPTSDNQNVPDHPRAVHPAPTRDPQRAGVATDRAVPKLDTGSGLDKAARSLTHVAPAANVGGNAATIGGLPASAKEPARVGKPPSRAKRIVSL